MDGTRDTRGVACAAHVHVGVGEEIPINASHTSLLRTCYTQGVKQRAHPQGTVVPRAMRLAFARPGSVIACSGTGAPGRTVDLRHTLAESAARRGVI